MLALMAALGMLATGAQAESVCAAGACVTEQHGNWGSGDCDQGQPYYGQHTDLAVSAQAGGLGAAVWTYNGCASYDDGTYQWAFSWLYGNAAVTGNGQLLLYTHLAWSAYEYENPSGSGSYCGVGYFAYTPFFRGGNGRSCTVQGISVGPPVVPALPPL